MIILTSLQRRILSILEEAGEEEFCALTNTVANAQGTACEIEAMRKALTELIDVGLIEVARVRDVNSRRWVPLSTAEAHAFFRDLGNDVQWSTHHRLWRWRSEMPRAQILLTNSGVRMAKKILSQDGWPEEPLDCYE